MSVDNLKLIRLTMLLVPLVGLGACNRDEAGLLATGKSQSDARAYADRAPLGEDAQRRTRAVTDTAASRTEPENPIAKTTELVSKVQQTLNHLAQARLAVDGIWGQRTKSAVRDFQAEYNLPVSGELNRATLHALGVAQPQVNASEKPG